MPQTKINTEYLYRNIDAWDRETYNYVWTKWLWGVNGNSLPIDQCWDMNEMHIYGILCCIRESVVLSSDANTYSTNEIFPVEDYPDLNSIHLHPDKPIEEFSLREMIDQLECFQLNWGKIIGAVLDNDQLDLVQHLLKACMSRIGWIAHRTFQTEGCILDDPQYITPLPNLMVPSQNKKKNQEEDSATYSVMSRKTLRQTVCVLFVLARIQSVIGNTKFIPNEPEQELERVIKALKQHHIESSMDFFNVFQQMIYLAPGMRIVYRTNFAGMYNDVSQVIYFHYPKYCRQPQIPLCDIPNSNMHLLPLLSQLIPDIPVFYDDDTNIPGLTDPSLLLALSSKDNKSSVAPKDIEPRSGTTDHLFSSKTTKGDNEEAETNLKYEWAWLVSCGEIFLLKYLEYKDEALGHPRKQSSSEEKKFNKLRLGFSDILGCEVYLSENRSLVNLVAFFLRCSKRKLGDEALGDSEMIIHKNNLALTAHGHVQLLD